MAGKIGDFSILLFWGFREKIDRRSAFLVAFGYLPGSAGKQEHAKAINGRFD